MLAVILPLLLQPTLWPYVANGKGRTELPELTGALKPGGLRVDAIAMTAQSNPAGTEWTNGGETTCADCGSPIEISPGMEKAFSICQPCYDAYVDNAGR
jgi:hypothetical protein